MTNLLNDDAVYGFDERNVETTMVSDLDWSYGFGVTVLLAWLRLGIPMVGSLASICGCASGSWFYLTYTPLDRAILWRILISSLIEVRMIMMDLQQQYLFHLHNRSFSIRF